MAVKSHGASTCLTADDVWIRINTFFKGNIIAPFTSNIYRFFLMFVVNLKKIKKFNDIELLLMQLL